MSADNVIYARRSTTQQFKGAIEDSRQRFLAARKIAPKFPSIRKLWDTKEGETLLMASFGHLNVNNTARYWSSNHALYEVLRRAEVPPQSARNILYDIGRPDMESPSGGKVQLGVSTPTIFTGNVPYAFQKEHRFNTGFTELSRLLVRALSNSEDAKSRIDTVVSLLEEMKADLDTVNGSSDKLVGAVLRLREKQFKLVGLEHVPEEPLHASLPTIAAALRKMEEYNLPFYRMPLTAEFDMSDTSKHKSFIPLLEALGDGYVPCSYLKAIEPGGARVPVAFNKNRFAFKHLNGSEIYSIAKDGVYEALAKGRLVPTVPVKMLADTVGPQIPHFGGPQWAKYAPAQIAVTAEWLGIPKRDAASLSLTLDGLVSYGVRPVIRGKHTAGLEGENLMHGFFVSYLTYGSLMHDLITQGKYAETDFGTVVHDHKELSELIRD